MPTAGRTRRRTPPSTGLAGLGDRVRRARKEAGLTLAQLGAPEYTRAHMSAIELGKIRPAVKTLEFISVKLGKPAGHFLGDEEVERKQRERDSHKARASQLIAAGRPGEAVPILTRLLEDTATSSERAELHRALGRAATQSSDGSRAVMYLDLARRYYEGRGDLENVLRCRAQLAGALYVLGSYSEAQEHLDAVLAAFARGVMNDPLLKVHVLQNLGHLEFVRGKYDQARMYYERAEVEGADVGDVRWYAGLLDGIGRSRHELGDYEAAITYFMKSEALYESLQNRHRATHVRYSLAQTFARMGNVARAAEVAADIERYSVDHGDTDLAFLAGAFVRVRRIDLGQPSAPLIAELEDLVKRADRSASAYVRAATRVTLAEGLRRSDPAAAEASVREAIKILEPTDERRRLADAYTALSEILGARGSVDEALKYATKAITVLRRN